MGKKIKKENSLVNKLDSGAMPGMTAPAQQKNTQTREQKKLTPKQITFCKEYLANGHNATKAARAAGYSAKTAYSIGAENLTKPEIKAYLDACGAENAAKFDYSLTEHIQDLDVAAELARKAGDYRTVLRAKELKGKVCGHYTEKHEVNMTGAVNVQLVCCRGGDED